MFAQTSSDLNPGGYRALFSCPARLDTRGNREITPARAHEQRFKVISPLIRSEIPLDPIFQPTSRLHLA